MNRKLFSLAAAFAVIVTSTALAAQAPAQLHSKADRASVGPTVAASTAGIRAPAQAKSLATVSRDAHMGAGTNVALMVVGGAALIVGAIIGGTPGILIAVAGAAIGLYGLYGFIQ